jgi:hypothetical protein
VADPSSTWDLIGDRLARLQSLLTDEAVDAVAQRYRAWKHESRGALAGLVEAEVLDEFDRAKGVERGGSVRRPTPTVYLDAAASRAFLTVLRREVEAQLPAERVKTLKLLELLDRRLGGAFRGTPRTNQDLQDGFETLLAGAEIDHARGGSPGPAFTFKDPSTALELKLCPGPGREEETLAAIRRDIAAWRSQYAHLIFGVWHANFIRDPEGFARTFKSEDGILVRVIRMS